MHVNIHLTPCRKRIGPSSLIVFAALQVCCLSTQCFWKAGVYMFVLAIPIMALRIWRRHRNRHRTISQSRRPLICLIKNSRYSACQLPRPYSLEARTSLFISTPVRRLAVEASTRQTFLQRFRTMPLILSGVIRHVESSTIFQKKIPSAGHIMDTMGHDSVLKLHVHLSTPSLRRDTTRH